MPLPSLNKATIPLTGKGIDDFRFVNPFKSSAPGAASLALAAKKTIQVPGGHKDGWVLVNPFTQLVNSFTQLGKFFQSFFSSRAQLSSGGSEAIDSSKSSVKSPSQDLVSSGGGPSKIDDMHERLVTKSLKLRRTLLIEANRAVSPGDDSKLLALAKLGILEVLTKNIFTAEKKGPAREELQKFMTLHGSPRTK